MFLITCLVPDKGVSLGFTRESISWHVHLKTKQKNTIFFILCRTGKYYCIFFLGMFVSLYHNL